MWQRLALFLFKKSIIMKNESLRLDELTENMSYTKVTAYKNGHLDIRNVVEDNKGRFYELSIHIDDGQALELYNYLKFHLNK